MDKSRVLAMNVMYEARIKAWLVMLGVEPTARNMSLLAGILMDVVDDLK